MKIRLTARNREDTKTYAAGPSDFMNSRARTRGVDDGNGNACIGCASPHDGSVTAKRLVRRRHAFTGLLKRHRIEISMDGKGSWRDNVFVERLWRSVKYEEVYLKAYEALCDVLHLWCAAKNSPTYTPTHCRSFSHHRQLVVNNKGPGGR